MQKGFNRDGVFVPSFPAKAGPTRHVEINTPVMPKSTHQAYHHTSFRHAVSRNPAFCFRSSLFAARYSQLSLPYL